MVLSGSMRSESLKGHLDMLLLATLRTAPAHGYLVVQRLAEVSGGELALPEATIYPALHRLERAGFLRSSRELHRGRPRRTYALTPAGESALAGKREEWERFARTVARTLEASG
jgi:PadR family transcriptional regulator